MANHYFFAGPQHDSAVSGHKSKGCYREVTKLEDDQVSPQIVRGLSDGRKSSTVMLYRGCVPSVPKMDPKIVKFGPTL